MKRALGLLLEVLGGLLLAFALFETLYSVFGFLLFHHGPGLRGHASRLTDWIALFAMIGIQVLLGVFMARLGSRLRSRNLPQVTDAEPRN
jgi:hypothetical protein